MTSGTGSKFSSIRAGSSWTLSTCSSISCCAFKAYILITQICAIRPFASSVVLEWNLLCSIHLEGLFHVWSLHREEFPSPEEEEPSSLAIQDFQTWSDWLQLYVVFQTLVCRNTNDLRCFPIHVLWCSVNYTFQAFPSFFFQGGKNGFSILLTMILFVKRKEWKLLLKKWDYLRMLYLWSRQWVHCEP